MADNIQVTQGSGTTMATDDIAGVQYPRVKVSWGVDGSAVDASATNPLPVTGTVTANAGTGNFTVAQATAASLNATVVGTGTFAVQAAQSGTWNIGNISGTISLPTGAAADSTVSTMSGKLPATLGQKTSAASMAVVVASDQSTIPVSLASVPSHPVTNAGTFAVQASQAGTWNIANVSGTVSLPTGAATETTLSGMSGKLPATLGQKAMSASMAVAIASDQSNVPVISNNSEVRISANFTRPSDTTAYAVGDLVANSTTSGSVVPLSFANAVRSAGDCVRIERVRIEKSGTSLTNASFRLHLFEASPTPTVGDNGVFNNAGVLATNNVLNHAGTFPVTMIWSGSDGAMGIGVPTTGAGATVSPTSGTTIYGLLEVTGAYTPASGEVFYVVLEGYRT